MASTTNCVYKTVSLSAGESYVLPAGAELVYVSDTTGITAENGCTTIPAAPATKCYMFQFLVSGSQVYDERDDRRWESFTYGNLTVNFDVTKTVLGWSFLGTSNLCYVHAKEIWDKIQAHPELSQLVVGVKVIAEAWSNNPPANTRGDQYGVVIKLIDVFNEVPIMVHNDKNNYNLLGNIEPNNMRTQSIGTEVDCGINTPQEPGGSCFQSFGTF